MKYTNGVCSSCKMDMADFLRDEIDGWFCNNLVDCIDRKKLRAWARS